MRFPRKLFAMWWFAVAVCAAAAAAASATPAAAVTLSQEGRAAVRIAIEPEGGEVVRFAAAELQKYLGQITGGSFALDESGATANAILIRATEPKAAPRAPISVDDDAYVIDVRADGVTLTGQKPRAALFAVYAFLEELGCRWLAPEFSFYADIGHESIPRRLTLTAAVQRRASRPDFAYRKKLVEEGRSHNAQNLAQLIDWMAKARLNVFNCPKDYKHRGVEWDRWRDALRPELRKRGLVIEVGGHGYENYLPPEKYFAAHPEWFGTDANGKPSPGRSIVFNTANPEALATLTREIIAYLRARPEIGIFDLFPPDAARWSSDPASLAQGSPSDRQALVLRHVDAALRAAGLPVMLESIAYAATLEAPQRIELPRDVMIDFCSAMRSYAADENDPACTENVPYHRAQQLWLRTFKGTFGIYSYYRKYSWVSKPVVLPTRIPREARYYREAGVQAFSSYAEPADWFTYEYQHYLLARVWWDTRLDPRRTLLDYAEHRYGAAGSAVADYLVAMEPVASGSWTVFGRKPGTAAELAKLEAGADVAGTALARAQSAAQGDARATEALRRLAVGYDYVRRDLEICRLYLNGDRAGIERKLAELERFFAANGDNGTILLKDRTGGKRLRDAYRQLLD